MARQVRAADIRSCIHCFEACGKPFALAGRACAVRCGVGINNCRGVCCGLGTCCAIIARGCAGCCEGLGKCCRGMCKYLILVFLVVALILVGAFLVYVYWDPIVTGFDTVRNGTVEYYDKTLEDPNVVQVLNKTGEYYEATKNKIAELGEHPEVQQIGNKTVELYGTVKDQISETFDKVHQSVTVQNAINGTVGFFSSLKDRLFG